MNPLAGAVNIRPASSRDAAAIWSILEPIIRAGETYALPRDMSRAEALAYWCAPDNEVFAATVGIREVYDCFLKGKRLFDLFHVQKHSRKLLSWQVYYYPDLR